MDSVTDLNIELDSVKNSPLGRIYVVGGNGYLGSRLVPRLVDDGWAVKVIDNCVYNQAPPLEYSLEAGGRLKFEFANVLDIPVPAGNEPVIWLASLHRDAKEDPDKHAKVYTDLMVRRPLGWLAAGHPLVYVSSMSVLTDRQSLYSLAKGLAEEQIIKHSRAFQILRFGTVWGGLCEDPTRPQTAINRAILGELPDETYMAFTTSLHSAVEALRFAPQYPFLGTIDNVFDSPDMVLREHLEAALEGEPRYKTVWGLQVARERSLVTALPGRTEELLKQPHPCDLIRAYYWGDA